MTLFDPFSLSGRNYLVTGAASGIGKSTGIILTRLGARVLLVDNNEDGLIETAGECGSAGKYLVLDLTESSSIKEKIHGVIPEFGKLHGIVHLAGKAYIAPLKSISSEKCHEIFSVNTVAAVELAKVFINRNVFAGEHGSIVLVSSVYGIVGSAANTGYAMSKSALHGITKSLSIELAGKGIRVNCVAPGFVKTKMLDASSHLFDGNYYELITRLHPLGLGEPEDIAYSVVFLLSDAAKWVTGAILSVDGGFTAQ